MFNVKTFNCERVYNSFKDDVLPLDIYTAASLGDINFFMRYDVGKLTEKINVSNLPGWTPLMYACSRGHSLLVNYLLKCGASRKCKTNSGVNPLMLAISSGDLTTVESVFDFLNLEERDYRNWTPLFYAIHFTREKCVNYLLSRGANVNITDFQNETPLMAAIKLGRETMVELILKTAKNLDVVSYKQESALMLACESSNQKIQKMVEKHYKNLNQLENHGVKLESETNLTPILMSHLRMSKAPQQHCSPTPLKQQIKSQISQIKVSKSLTYSPNRTAKCSPQTPSRKKMSPVWRVPFSKRFWSPQLGPYSDVEKFLKGLGLEKYWPIFRDEEVDFETLLTLNEENLKELGIVLFGPRKKIFLAIQQLQKSTKKDFML